MSIVMRVRHDPCAQTARYAVLFSYALLTCAISRCGGVEYPLTGRQAVTLVNLRVQENRGRLFAVGYLEGTLLPVCTPIVVQNVNRNRAQLRLASGQTIDYTFARNLVEDRVGHLDNRFGVDCGRAAIDTLSPLDQQGIRDGNAYPGMTRQAVYIALGPPPANVNTYEGDSWRYARSRSSSIIVRFANNVVVDIQDVR